MISSMFQLHWSLFDSIGFQQFSPDFPDFIGFHLLILNSVDFQLISLDNIESVYYALGYVSIL